MNGANNAQQKRTKTPSRSFFQSAPASVMKPRLMVILSAAALLVLGLVMVYSASSITGYVEEGSSVSETIKQVLYAAIGLVFCFAAIIFGNENALRGNLGLIFCGVCAFLILLTAAMGTVGLGAKRWLFIGPIGIQPSEFAKIAIVIMAARVICSRNEGLISDRSFLYRILGVVVLPIVFILFAQSDLGTTVICFIAFLTALWLGGANVRLVGGIFGAIVVLAVIMTLAQGYRSDRMSFLDPWADPDDTGYQLIHSFKAFAAGGLFGLGIGNSYEKLLYLPEAETDFIFSIVGEELGLLGATLVVVLFLVFMRGGLSIARQASSDFGLILAGSLTTMLVFQAFLNILCVIGMAPTTGKPLPFISSGGSSLISSLLIVGIILSVSLNSNSKREFKERRDNLRVVSSYSKPANTRRGRQGDSLSGRFYSVGSDSSQAAKRVIPLRSQDFRSVYIPNQTRNNYSRRR